MGLMPGVQFEEVWKAFNSAFSRDSLSQMLRLKLNRRLDHLVADGSLSDMTFELISLAEREGWHTELIQAAYQFNPRNQELVAVYDKYGLLPTVSVQQAGHALEAAPDHVSAIGFEKTIHEHLPTFDIVLFREGLMQVEGWICRIESKGNARGSGFLIGPDLVMTNYHVMDTIIQNPALSQDIRCRFDYKLLNDGARQMGVEVPLHQTDWNVCFSQFAPAEERGEPDAELPTVDQLDYAILKLAEPIGQQPVRQDAPTAPARGWVKFPAELPQVTPPVPLIIAQHPDGAPLKLSMDTNGIKSVNENQTRVRYDTTTESGSSGSPCFQFDWTPVALHHYGDPGSRFHKPSYNQGVPFRAIREHLRRNDLGELM